eukprot:scaffold2923_cov121-Cylindrotheca_fusiformis.AAC.9
MTASDVDLVRLPGLDSAEKDAATVASANTSNSFEDERITSNEFSLSKSSVGVLNSGVNWGAPSSSSGTSWRTKAKSDEFEIMPRSSNIPTNNSMLSELTINKFNIKSMGLIGREREIKVLKSCYGQMIKEEKERAPYDQSISEHLMEKEKQRTPYDQSIYAQSLIHSTLHKELVFISGYSGVGKSSLAKTLEKEIAKTTSGIYVEGKFHLNASDEPYSGIVSAFGEMCKRILKRQSQPRKNAKQDDDSLSFGSRLSATLGPAGSVLSDFISELQDILPHTRRNSDDSDSERCDFDVVKKRVKHAFRLLMRALNAEFSPIVLVLDDLHWADDSSLEVIDFLISDLQNPTALMIVGCYRSNEVDNESLLLKKIQALRKKQDKFNFHTTDIEVESCDIDSVNKMIMAMMSIDDEELTRGLAEVCYKRTAGNPFFLIEFMQMLQEHSLISYNLGLLKWIWDEDRIATATVSAENVVDLLKVRMRKLPANVQLFLQYAACLGSSFSTGTLNLIWREQVTMNTECTTDTIINLLGQVVSSNLVEACGQNEYRWVHDKIQEAALSLSDIVTPEVQFQIGIALYHSLDTDELEEQLFDVVDLINNGQVSEQLDFAKLNLRAAEKAKKISAFQSAAKYATNGIELLPKDKWTTHRTLTLALYTIGSEVELASGRVERAERYSNAVLNRKEFTTMEVLPLKMAKISKLCTVDLKFKETIQECLDLLKDLCVNLVWSGVTTPFQAVTTLMRTIKMAKKAPAPDDFFGKLGYMKDLKHRAVMVLLARLCYACYNTDRVFLNTISCCKIVEMTLKYGVCDISAPGFAGLGVMVILVQQDYKTAAFFADVGLAVQEATRASREAETIYVAQAFCLAWSRPLQQSLTPTADGYASGMRSGDTVFAMWNLITHHVWLPYTMGKRLGPILEQCSKLLSQMEEVSQPEQAICLTMFWQMMLNLATVPATEDLHRLEGDIFSAESFTGTEAVHRGMVHMLQGELLVFYDIEAAAKRAIKDGDKFAKLAAGFFQNMLETYHRAIALFVMARRTRKRKYRFHADKLANRIAGWVRSGNPNVRHYHAAMKAEQAALNKKYDLAEQNYKNAIVLAAKTGHMHHAALINERYAEFLREERSDEEESKHRFGEAIRFYEEWGAFGKVEMLKNQLH